MLHENLCESELVSFNVFKSRLKELEEDESSVDAATDAFLLSDLGHVNMFLKGCFFSVALLEHAAVAAAGLCLEVLWKKQF